MTMRAYEFILTEAQQQLSIQPDAIRRNATVLKMVGDIASSDAQRPPTETDKVQAMMNYSKLKKQANQNLVQRLRQQLANAEASVK